MKAFADNPTYPIEIAATRKFLPRVLLLLALLLVVLALVSCAAGPNALQKTAGGNDTVAGFWRGVWHGFICFFTLIASAFSNSVTIYEVHNNGGWYNLGFVFGVMMFFGGSGAGSKGRKRWCS
jgi:hypothetical protein